MRVSERPRRHEICRVYAEGGTCGLSISPGISAAEAVAALREILAAFDQLEQRSPDVRRRTHGRVLEQAEKMADGESSRTSRPR